MDDMTADAAPAPVGAAGIRELPIEFRGSGGEYFRIWIVNLLLTIVTIGIYSAWAKVRRLRYFHGSTLLDGQAFDYHGQPVAILKGRAVAFIGYVLFVFGGQLSPIVGFVALPLVLFGLPWLMVKSKQFQMRMTSWRGLRFRFTGLYGGALATYVGWPMLVALSLGLLFPFWLWKNAQWVISNTAYGTQPMRFEGRAGQFYKIAMLSSLLALGVGVVIAVVVGLAGAMMSSSVLALGAMTGPDAQAAAMAFLKSGGVLLIVVPLLLWQLVSAYFKSATTNATIGGIAVGPHRLQSRLRALPLAWILASNLVGVVLTLGLFYPWAKVRVLRYQLANTSVLVTGSLDDFAAAATDTTGAVGEEIGDFLDVDFGL